MPETVEADDKRGLSPVGAARSDEAPAFVKTFPCTGCGARLSFAPGTRELRCEYCGTANAIAEDDGRVEELDFNTYLSVHNSATPQTKADLMKVIGK